MAIDVDKSNFKEQTSEGLVLVDFHAPWCGPCRALGPTLDQLQNVKVVKVNVDSNKELAVEHNVSTIPKIVFYRNGENLGEYFGPPSKDLLQKKIDEFNGDL